MTPPFRVTKGRMLRSRGGNCNKEVWRAMPVPGPFWLSVVMWRRTVDRSLIAEHAVRLRRHDLRLSRTSVKYFTSDDAKNEKLRAA
jgi:hypothetical protein